MTSIESDKLAKVVGVEKDIVSDRRTMSTEVLPLPVQEHVWSNADPRRRFVVR